MREIPKSDYSQIAKYYDKARQPASPTLISRIVKLGRIHENSIVLDVGCGTGRFTLSLPASKKLLCGLEPEIEMLRQAAQKDKHRRIHWVRGDGQKLPFKDSVFNNVYMTAVIHHIKHKDLALKEIYRVLKAGGTCLIMTFSHSGIRKHILRDFPGVVRTDLKRVPSIPSLKKMIAAVGFNKIHHHAAQVDEGCISTEEYLQRVRSKYISTLTLLPEREFKRGLDVFESRAKKKYGDRIRRISSFVFVNAEK